MCQHDPVFLFTIHIPVSTLKLKAEKIKPKFTLKYCIPQHQSLDHQFKAFK